MDYLKIKVDQPKFSEKELSVKKLYETDEGVLTVVIDGKYNYVAGNKIHFRRFSNFEQYDSVLEVSNAVSTIVNVKHEEENGSWVTKLIMDAPKRNDLFIESVFPVCEFEVDDDGTVTSGDPTEFRLNLSNYHNVFAQDIVSCLSNGSEYNLIVYDSTESTEIDEIKMCEYLSIVHTIDNGVKPEDFLLRKFYNIDFVCDNNEDEDEEQERYYIPRRLVRNSVFVDASKTTLADIEHRMVNFSQNEFYCKTKKKIDDRYYECRTWDELNIGENNQTDFVEEDENRERTKVVIAIETNYWEVSVGFTENSDYQRLYQEEMLNTLFADNIKKSIVPDFINMEKLKYRPIMGNGGVDTETLKFNLHFKKRDGKDWHYLSPPEWNQEENESDLLGYLNFTDNDVRYQKMKVGKSFLRLSFFDSNDPLEQSLLYYSTIFFDGGALFGKYMKVRNHMLKKGLVVDDPEEPAAVIKYSGDTGFTTRVDSQFVVKDEYQMDMSSEGFNIYLFADDAPNEENPVKTIYMKVEFNHAGLGRTIPFVAAKSAVNFHDSNKMNGIKNYLYIPVKIAYINGRYCYYVEENDVISFDDRTITFNMYEPILNEN